MSKKELAALLAAEAAVRAQKDLSELFATFLLNPSAILYNRTVQGMHEFQTARGHQHQIAEWED